MKLYEVNQAIELLFAQAIDPDTGEVLMDPEELSAQLAQLQMERQSILDYLAKLVLNTRAESAAIKDEEDRLKARRAALDKKEARVMAILDRECAGQKTDCGVATVCYRRTERVEVADDDAACTWLDANGHSDCVKVTTALNKTETKKLLKAGITVPGTALVQDLSCSLR